MQDVLYCLEQITNTALNCLYCIAHEKQQIDLIKIHILHYSKNSLNLRMKTKAFTAGADAFVTA